MEIEELTVAYSDEDSGEDVIKELGKEILSKVAWPTVMFLYQALRRYRKMNGMFKAQGKFKITGKAQAEAIMEVLKKWYNI